MFIYGEIFVINPFVLFIDPHTYETAMTNVKVNPIRLFIYKNYLTMKRQLLFCFACLTVFASLNAQTLVKNMSSANNDVYAVYKKGGSYYIGGAFTYVGLNTGYGALSTVTNDYPNMSFPQFNGQVYALIPDGNGGWYAGGNFTTVGGIAKAYVAHVKSNNTVDNSFTANCNSTVKALLKFNGRLYIGGSFSTVNGTTRLYAAAVNSTTGALVNSWNPSPNSTVNAITLATGADTTIWLGGNFTTINSSNLLRPYLANVNTTNGNFVTGSVSADYIVTALTTHNDSIFIGGEFSRLGLKTDYLSSINEGGTTSDQGMPNANGAIRCIIPDGSGGWYVGGSFTQIGNVNKSYIAHIKSDKTVDNNFTATCNSTVYAIVKDGTKLYLGGVFTNVNSTPRNRLAAVNATSGALVTTWDPNANSDVYSLALKDSVIIAGGYFTAIGVKLQNAYKFAVIKKTDGSLIGGFPGYDQQVNKVSVLGDSILAGGNYTHAAYYSPYSTKITTTNVKPDPNFPSANGTIYCVAKDAAGNFYVGGSFTTIGGVNQAYIAKLNSSMQVVAGWAPQVNSYVRSIVVVGTTVYIGGSFTTTNTVSRPYISALNTSNPGSNKTWNSSLNSYVYSLVTDGTSIYAGGQFTQANGVTARGLLAKFNLSGTLDNTWNPNASGGGGYVLQLAISGTSILAGGSFTTVGATTRNYLAKLNNTNGNASNWATANSYVYALYVDGSACYVGGYFTQLTPPGGSATARNYIGGINISNGNITTFNPSPNNDVFAITKAGSNLYFGGQFTQINGTARNYLASTNTSGTLQSWNPSANNTVNNIFIDSLNNIIIGGNFTGLQQNDRTYASIIKYSGKSLASWAPVLDYVVYDITYNTNRIFIGGGFHTVNGSARSGFAAFGLGGSLQTTNLNLAKGGTSNVTVYSLFSSGNKIYIGGNFDKAKSSTRNNFAEADISSGSGTVLATNPNLDDVVYAINVQSSKIAYGGNFRFSNFLNRSYLASYRISTNSITSWNPLPDSYVFGIAANFNKLFVVGQFDNINGSAHQGAVAFSLSTGGVSSTWNPQLSRSGNGIYADLNAVAADSNYVYLGGNFDQVAGKARSNAAVVAASNAAVQNWNTGPNTIVRAIAVNGNNIFVGGDFTFCKGAARSYIAKIDSATGLVNASWNPGANNYIYAITGNGSNIYVGGSFTQLAGVTRTALGAVSTSTGTATSFDPVIQSSGSTGNVYTLAFDTANVLYVGGSFNTAKGSTRNELAALSISGAGSLKSWNPNANNAVYALAVAGTKIYVGGAFTTLNGSTTRNYFACVNNTNGTVTSFNPNMNSYVHTLSVSNNNTLYVGGQFTTVNGGTSRSYAAAYDATSGSLKSWNPVPNNVLYAIAAQTDTVYLGGYFTLLNGSSFNYLAAVRGSGGTSNLSSFNPNLAYDVRNEYISERTLLVGGQFSTVGGSYRNAFAVFKLPGNNSFTQTDGNNVIAESAVIKQLETKAFTIYPNPASQTANIKFANALNGKAVVTITDMNGNKVLQKDLSGSYLNYIKLDVNTLKNGSYIISINGDNFNEKRSLIIAK